MTLPPKKLPHQRVLSCFIGGAAAEPIDPTIDVPSISELWTASDAWEDPTVQNYAWYLRQEGYDVP